MSTSRAIKKPKRDDTQLAKYQPMPERAPSIEREEPPTVARVLAMIGLFFAVLGTLAMLAPMWHRSAAISPDWGFRFASAGVLLLIYHAFVERDLQFRRMYGFLGLALMVTGVVIRAMAFRAGYSSWFLLYGLPAASIGLVIAVAVLRNETDQQFRKILLNTLGGVGALTIAFAAAFGMRDVNYLPGEGAVLLLLGLLYVGAFIGMEDAGSDRAHYAALGLGALGAVGIVVAVVASYLSQGSFLVPRGLIIIGMSIVYIAVSLGICCDWPIVVIARRDLSTYFYSPIGYLVFLGILIIGWFMFWLFVVQIVESTRGGGMPEPIVGNYIFHIFPVIVQMFVLPVLTMRLFSEEIRTGTLEVMLTAPVNEISLVVGKFLACWIFLMLTWLPWWLFLVALRFMGGEEFDYRPVLSFTIALGIISAGLLSMGIFFSSLTSNQIIAAVLTFVGMMMHLVFYFIKFLPDIREGTVLNEVFTYINFFDLWLNSLGGIVAPRYLVFHASVAIFFLFATVIMLNSRKWK
jgi:ABC-type transport system involved in multi-copper enzyme maturation permease subunit